MDSTKCVDIVSAYGCALERRTGALGDERTLPYHKDRILRALLHQLLEAPSELREPLKIGVMELEPFVPGREFQMVLRYERWQAGFVRAGEEHQEKRAHELLEHPDFQLTETYMNLLHAVLVRKGERLEQLRNLEKLLEFDDSCT